MANATTRAHVAERDVIPASADPDIENYATSKNEDSKRRTAKGEESLSRAERRKLKKQNEQQPKLDIPAKQLEELKLAHTEPEVAEDSGYQTDGSEPQLSKNQLKKLKKAEHKKQQQQQKAAARLDPSGAPACERKPAPSSDTTITTTSIERALTSAMPPTAHPLLICSLGNPGPQYANTLHSAGHVVINIIRERGIYLPFKSGLAGRVSTPNLTSWKFSFPAGYRKEESRGLTEGEDDFTLWQSTKLMNVSGPSVKSAWQQFSKQRGNDPEPRLVVLHDELESALGKVSIKQGSASPRGHNGLKSCQNSLGSQRWWRVGVGIGRPESREQDVVSKYVLRKMTSPEEKAMERAAVGVLDALRNISEGKA